MAWSAGTNTGEAGESFPRDAVGLNQPSVADGGLGENGDGLPCGSSGAGGENGSGLPAMPQRIAQRLHVGSFKASTTRDHNCRLKLARAGRRSHRAGLVAPPQEAPLCVSASTQSLCDRCQVRGVHPARWQPYLDSARSRRLLGVRLLRALRPAARTGRASSSWQPRAAST